MSNAPFVHPDYWHLLGGQTPPAKPPVTDVYAIRESTTKHTKMASDALPFPAGMTTSVSTTTSADGSKLNITRFVPLSVQQRSQDTVPDRAIIWVFGGGLVAGSVAISFNMIASFAERTGTQVFAPDYRLAPEHPFPAALEDVYASITWLQAHAKEFNVDPARIVTVGQSAGGGLAAAAALKAKDEALSPPIAAQVLTYPMLDDRTQIDPQDLPFPFLVWTPNSNSLAWKAYLGEKANEGEAGSVNIPYTAVPGRAEDLRGLPPTFLGVGDLDLFLDEVKSFAARLSSQGVKVQSKVYSGVPHGFDAISAISLGAELWNDETTFIQQF
ncbi:hypothetical protein KVR01_000074 [Diaporthe batatas]|uniref:uncharacterized protein n=1 Tax=Diaporthe batatas TaxID=748121 RepID=UPI001D037468|nr:uncharacterized protein KVR01_000074 [Diaporthe batatas]KAG8169329.1 hypothetical protein KVR01_000074 [Diaporthe batatas]